MKPNQQKVKHCRNSNPFFLSLKKPNTELIQNKKILFRKHGLKWLH